MWYLQLFNFIHITYITTKEIFTQQLQHLLNLINPTSIDLDSYASETLIIFCAYQNKISNYTQLGGV